MRVGQRLFSGAMVHGLKEFLNEQANRRLAGLGYSDGMIRDAKREAWWWLIARRDALARRRGLLAGEAVVWTDTGRAELIPVEVPAAGPGEVTIAVATSVVSPGTERAQYLRLPGARVSYPHRPGYSAAGTVFMVGKGVTGIAPGDRVAAAGPAHASVVTLRAERVYRIPEGVSLEAAALVQLGVIASQGVRHAELRPGEPLCVLGLGLVGALAQRIASASGGGPVTAVVRSSRKQKVAETGGVQRLIALEEDEGALAGLSFPVVIEASGDPDAVATAIRLAEPGGRVVLLGSARGVTHAFPLREVRRKRVTVIGAHVETLTYESRLLGFDAHAREAGAFLARLADGSVPVADLVDLWVDPREADAFYRELARSRDLVAARFDWTKLSNHERVHGARLWRPPDVRGRGMDAVRKPLVLNGRRPARDELPTASPYGAVSGDLRVGLVGCGDIAVHNAAGLAEAPNARLSACFDPDAPLAEELARQYGVAAAPSFESLLDRADVDAVFLAVPHHLHAPLAIEAADAGKHVIVEKPLANDLESAAAMVAAAERAGVVLSVCFPHRYDPNALLAHRLVGEGALGSFAGTILNFYSDKPASYWFGGFSGRSSSGWRSSRTQAGGGVLIMNVSHLVDLLRHLAGEEAEECFALTQVVDGPAEVEDGISVTVRYASGAVGTIFASSALRGQRAGGTKLDMWGSHGFLSIEPELRVYTLKAIEGLRTARWQSFPHANTNIRAAYLSRLATAIDMGEEPDVSARDGLAVQAFMEAAYRSSELGAPVRPAELLERVGA